MRTSKNCWTSFCRNRRSSLAGKWVTDNEEQRSFENVNALFTELIRLQKSGRTAQEKGAKREEEAGGSAGLESEGGERGEVIYENNRIELYRGYGGQDPYLKHPDGSTLSLDTIDTNVWRLVGGPAKAKSSQAVNNELRRLTVLKKCCDQDGRHTTVVHYKDINNPEEELFNRLVTGALKRGVKVYVNGEELHPIE